MSSAGGSSFNDDDDGGDVADCDGFTTVKDKEPYNPNCMNVSGFRCTNPRRSKTEPVPELRQKVRTSAGKIKHFEFSHFTLSLHNKYFSLTLSGGSWLWDWGRQCRLWIVDGWWRKVLPVLIQEGSNVRWRYFLSVLFSAFTCSTGFYTFGFLCLKCFYCRLSRNCTFHKNLLHYYPLRRIFSCWWLPQQVDGPLVPNITHTEWMHD